jgi:hypothetical protein
MPKLTDNIFRFVSVRAPEPETSAQHGFTPIRVPTNQALPLFNAFQNLDNAPNAQEAARTQARAFIDSNEYVFNDAALATPVNALSAAYRVLLDRSGGPQTVSAWRAAFQQAPRMQDVDLSDAGQPGGLESKLWQSLLAHRVLTNYKPEQREVIIEALRALHFATVLRELKDDDKLDARVPLTRPVVLPKISFRGAPQADPAPPPAPNNNAEVIETAKRTLKTLFETLQAIDDTLNDLNRLYRDKRARLDQDAAELEASPPGAPSPKTGAPERIEQALRSDEGDESIQDFLTTLQPPRRLWRFEEGDAEKLSDTSLRTLKKFDLSLESANIFETMNVLRREKGQLIHAVLPGVVQSGVSKIGQAVLPTNPTHSALLSGINPLFPGLGNIEPVSPPGNANRPQPLPPAVLRRGPGSRVNAIGIADLMVVEQQLLRYELGEVAHVENVLLSEHKSRKHRRLHQVETLLVEETETTEESERDLQSTERFELQRESQKTIESDMSIEAGISVTASYGTVEATAYGDFAYHQSRSESHRNATRYANDVLQRSVARFKQRVREERTRRTLEEFEETNKHGFDNTQGQGHVIGYYRWLDKVYQAQVMNYGQRLMLEFVIPEPAAFYNFIDHFNATRLETLKPPPEPLVVETTPPGSPAPYVVKPLVSPRQLAEDNYQLPVGMLNVSGVEPPPPLHRVLGTAFEKKQTQEELKNYAAIHKELEIPDGYAAKEVTVTLTGSAPSNDVIVGSAIFSGERRAAASLMDEEGILPIAFYVPDYPRVAGTPFAGTAEVRCERLPRKLEEWQLNTFNAIMTTYQDALTRHDEKLAARSIQEGVRISGRPSAINRDIERRELKKHCIRVLTNDDFSAYNAMGAAVGGYPEFDLNETLQEARTIQFFEQAFEWNQMTYLFYPYFWGRRPNWPDTLVLEDADPLFTQFLQAGAARVQIPVRPAYNDAVLHYLASDPPEIWNGGSVPVPDDPLYVSIAQSIQEATGAPVAGIPVGEPWIVRVPTTLVALQQGNEPPNFTGNDN